MSKAVGRNRKRATRCKNSGASRAAIWRARTPNTRALLARCAPPNRKLWPRGARCKARASAKTNTKNVSRRAFARRAARKILRFSRCWAASRASKNTPFAAIASRNWREATRKKTGKTNAKASASRANSTARCACGRRETPISEKSARAAPISSRSKNVSQFCGANSRPPRARKTESWPPKSSGPNPKNHAKSPRPRLRPQRNRHPNRAKRGAKNANRALPKSEFVKNARALTVFAPTASAPTAKRLEKRQNERQDKPNAASFRCAARHKSSAPLPPQRPKNRPRQSRRSGRRASRPA